MSPARKTLRFLIVAYGWVLPAGSTAVADAVKPPGDSSVMALAGDAATGGDEFTQPASSRVARPGASLSIRVGSEGEQKQFMIKWTGQPHAAILVVSVDSNEQSLTRPGILWSGEVFGILLLRSIGTSGQATIGFDADTLAHALSDSDLLISIKVVSRLSLQDVADPPNKSRPRILHEESLSPADFTASFQVLDRGDSLDTAIFGGIARFRRGPSRQGRAQATVDIDSIMASLQLALTLGSDDPVKP